MGFFDFLNREEDEEKKKKFRETVGRLFGNAIETGKDVFVNKQKSLHKSFTEEIARRAKEEREETEKVRLPKFAKKIGDVTETVSAPVFGKNLRKITEGTTKFAGSSLVSDPLAGIESLTSLEKLKKRSKEVGKLQTGGELLSLVPVLPGFTKTTKFGSAALRKTSAGSKLLKLGEATAEEAPKILKVGGGKYQLGTLGVTDDVLDGIKTVAKQNEELIKAQRRGKITFEQTKQAAADLGMTVEQLKRTKKGTVMTDAEIVASGDIVKSISDGVANLSKAYEETPEALRTTAQKAELLEKMNEQGLILSKLFGAESEAGRALNSIKAIKMARKDMTEEGFRNIFKQFKGEDNVDEIFKKYNQLTVEKGKEAAYKYLRSMQKSNFGDLIREFWYNSILSAPTTHIINNISNAAMAALSPVERLGSAFVELPSAKIGGRERERLFGEALADPIGGFMGIKDGAKKALHMLVNGYSVDDITLTELHRPEAFLRGKAGLIKPTRWLNAADQFYKSVNYSSDLYAQAYRAAVKSGAKGRDVLKVTGEFIDSPSKKMMDKAGKMARYRVFQEEPGKISSAILSLREKLPLGIGTFILPFAQTPSNLLKSGIERSPAGLLTNVPRLRGAEQSDSIARAAIGSIVAGALATYAVQGKITGAAPKDKNEADAFYREGKQPYAVKIGDKWVQYNRIEPYNVPLTMVASAWDQFVNNKEAPNTEKILKIGTSIGNSFLTRGYLSGLSNVLNALDEPDRYGGRFLENVAVGFLPGSSFLRTVTRITDPVIRDPEGVAEAIKSAIPGLSFNVQPRRNVYGEEIRRESALGDFAGNLFPIRITKEKTDFVDQELKNLEEVVGYPVLTKFKAIGGEKGRKAADEFLKNQGGYMKQWLYNFMTSDEYKSMDDEDKVKAVNKVRDLSRDRFRNRIMASVYLFNEGTKSSYEEKLKLYNELKEKEIINNSVDEWIYYLRNNPDDKVGF